MVVKGGADAQALDLCQLIFVVRVLLCEPTNSEDFGSLKETTKRALMHVNFSVVDKFHQGMEVSKGHIL